MNNNNKDSRLRIWYIIFAHAEHFFGAMLFFSLPLLLSKGIEISRFTLTLILFVAAGSLWLIYALFFKGKKVNTKYAIEKDFNKERWIYLPLTTLLSFSAYTIFMKQMIGETVYYVMAVSAALLITICINLLDCIISKRDNGDWNDDVLE